MPNPQRLQIIQHYTDQNVNVTDIAKILLKGKKKPTISSMRSLIYWYIKTYKIKRKEPKPF